MPNIQSLLTMCGVPSSSIADAEASISKAKPVYKEKVAPFSWRAPFVMWGVCRSLSWDAEKLPDQYWQYDNNISINGDRGRWFLDGATMKRMPVPLSPGNSQIGDGDTRLYQYWTFAKLSARHWFARWVWLGIRNRASRAAADAGPFIYDYPGKKASEYIYSDSREKIIVRNIDDVWQIQRTKIYGPFHVRCNLGYKLDCVNRIDRRAPVVWVPFAVKIRFNNKFDI